MSGAALAQPAGREWCSAHIARGAWVVQRAHSWQGVLVNEIQPVMMDGEAGYNKLDQAEANMEGGQMGCAH